MFKYLSAIAIISLILISLGCGSSDSHKHKTEKKKINALIDSAIVLIDNEDFDGLIRLVASPEDKEIMQFEGSWEKVVRRYSLFRKEVRASLEECYTMEPVFNADSSQATYKVTNLPTDFIFKRVDGVWYLGN